jgi:hypothetical protein
LYSRLEFFYAVGTYLITVANPVTFENPAEDFRYKTVQLFAIPQIREFRAVCTGTITSLDDAFFYRAVSEHRLIAITAQAFLLFVSPALGTYQTAAGNIRFAVIFSHL